MHFLLSKIANGGHGKHIVDRFEYSLQKVKLSFVSVIVLILLIIGGGGVLMQSTAQEGGFIQRSQEKYVFDFSSYPLGQLSQIQIPTRVSASALEVQEALAIPVFVYHGIVPLPDGINVTFDDFLDQMQALKEAGYQTLTLSDFYSILKGEKTLPKKSFLLTFDDGRKDSYYPVDSILEKLNYHAVIFVLPKFSFDSKDSTYYLNKEELKSMVGSGRWSIGSHGYSGHNAHKVDKEGKTGSFYSNLLWFEDQNRLEREDEFIERVSNDLKKAKERLETELNITILGFAYPFGDYGQESRNFAFAEERISSIVKDIYPLTFYQVRGAKPTYRANYLFDSHLYIKRMLVEPSWNKQELLKVVENSQEKKLPYTDLLSADRGWISLWGSSTIGQDGLHIRATEETTGGMSVLDGTYHWENYRVAVVSQLKSGQVFTLVSRHKDQDNFLSCKFSESGFTLSKRVNGTEEAIQQWRKKISFADSEVVKFEMVNNGGNISCLLNGVTAVKKNNVDASLSRGGIGFTVWGPEIGKNEFVIKELHVEEIQK